MACTTELGLQKCDVDPSDPEALRQAMATINKLVDVVREATTHGRPIMDSAGNGEYIRDSADDSIVRQTFKVSGQHWPHIHGPGATSRALDGVVWTHSGGGALSVQNVAEGYAFTEAAADGHFHGIYFTSREAWDAASKSAKPEGAS
jgi:hypothetical protein